MKNSKELPGINPQTFKIVLEKPYWQELSEEYNVFPSGEIMDGEVEKYFKKDQEQSKHLLDKYAEISWKLNDLANTLRAEKISESFFRQLCRYLLHKNFENKLNHYCESSGEKCDKQCKYCRNEE